MPSYFLMFFSLFHFSDRTPPMVIITSKPATFSNKNPFTFGFNCRETCSFECSVRQRGINPSYSPCNSNRFKASNLQNGKTYVFYVRGTDDVGNQGNPASYTWKVGESILTGLKKINFTFLLVTTKLVTGGGGGEGWKTLCPEKKFCGINIFPLNVYQIFPIILI